MPATDAAKVEPGTAKSLDVVNFGRNRITTREFRADAIERGIENRPIRTRLPIASGKPMKEAP